MTDPTLPTDLRTWLSGPGKGWEATEPGSLVVRALARDEAQAARIEALEGALNTPELHNFSKAVVLEAAHQRERWGSDHDAGKATEDWFWLVGYLAGKALNAAKNGDDRKAKHHTISTAAALANWHAALNDDDHRMRPGIDPARNTLTGGNAP